MIKAVALVLAISIGISTAEYRSYDGSGNNVANPTWGAAGTNLLRKGPNSYTDGLSAVNMSLPNTRQISNVVFNGSTTDTPRSPRGFTDYLTFWGQFIDHDFDFSPSTSMETLTIDIPACDPYFDPYCYGNKSITIHRTGYDNNTGTVDTRQHPNLITSYLDASMVYGSDSARAAALRSMTDGKLKVTSTANGDLPPKNTYGFFMDNGSHFVADNLLLFVGDVRGNENPALASLHTVFVREHNRLCDQFKAANASLTDEELYQLARKWVGAYIQSITTNEYMVSILGQDLPAYTGYNSAIDATIATEFSSGAFRYGHTEVNSHIWRLFGNGTRLDLPLRYYYFNPLPLDDGIEPILAGIAMQLQSEVDVNFVDDIRNFLFGAPGSGGLDLVAINLMRGRDNGIGKINQIRTAYGLTPYTSFSQVTSNATIAAHLAAVYESVDQCDIYACGLAEDHAPFANVGPTFKAVIMDQYIRVRDGDRFWYQNPGVFTATELQEIQSTTLAQIIMRNTKLQMIQCYVMSKADTCFLTANGTYNGPSTTSGQTFDHVVTVVVKQPSNPYYGQGASVGYAVDGNPSQTLTLVRGVTYRFLIQASCSHTFYFSTNSVGSGVGEYTTGVTGTGCDNQILTFTPDATTPATMYYQCFYHNYMGGMINIVDASTTGSGSATGTSTSTSGSVTSSTSSTTSSHVSGQSSASSFINAALVVLMTIAALL